MNSALKSLIDATKKLPQSRGEAEQQRRSFVYGNTKFENDDITWDMVNEQADALKNE